MRDGVGVPAWLARLAVLGEDEIARVIRRMTDPAVRALDEWWTWQRHLGQSAARPDWRVWLIMAGRGFGKTRAGAEWVWARARSVPGAKIALVGASADEVAKVMVEGPSGLLAAARTDEAARWIPTRGTFLFGNGAEAFAYSAEAAEKLRGAQHHFAWADELAKWPRAEAVWDNLQLGLRMGRAPRAVVTTTPRPIALLKRLMVEDGVRVSRGATRANVHLPESFRAAVEALYGGTRLGRQELEGALIEEVEGALWTRESIEKARVPAVEQGALVRVVVAVDPPASEGGDACGIVVAGLGKDGVAYVLADLSAHGCSPEGWARLVADAAAAWDADRIVAEGNNGGAMVESVLRAADSSMAVKMVFAREAKGARAEPVEAAFSRGRAKLAGSFPELEDEMAAMTAAGGWHGPGRSPDRADAMVWAVATLVLDKPRAEPGIRRL